MKVGDLVTAAESPEGAPEWLGVLESEAGFFELGYPPDMSLASRGQRFTGPKRLITDDEALALAAWLVTGDPWCWWLEDDDGACVLTHVDGPDTALWSCPEGEWAAYVPGQESSIAHGHAPTDRARRVAASRAFLAHLCTGGQTT